MRTKTEDRRQRIVEAAAELFQEQGYEQTSMSQVAQRVGGSKATLYNYYPSKAELFVAVMQAAAQQTFSSVFTQLDDNEPIDEVLQRFGVHYLQAVLTPQALATYRMAVHEGDRSEVGCLLWDNGPAQGWALMAQFLARAQAQGALIAEAQPQHAAWHFKALLEAELMDQRLLGVRRGEIPQQELSQCVERATWVWCRAYAVPGDKPA
jgi:AcrR family transcriptional regulator